MKFRDKLMQFMQGRHGVDQFSRFTMGAGLVLMVISIFIPEIRIRSALEYTGIALLIYSYYRILSRNHSARYRENSAYLRKTEKVRGWFRTRKSRKQYRKQYHIYTCPQCKQKIRIPKGKGKIEISCPKCGKKFIKRS